jgi:transketolase
VHTGAAVVRAAKKPQLVLAATGSEVALCVAAAEQLDADGVPTQVVSMPSWDRFAAQPPGHRRKVFPAGVPVLSVEAGVTFGWAAFADASVGIDRFGASAPGAVVMDKLGINVPNVVKQAKRLVNQRKPK